MSLCHPNSTHVPRARSTKAPRFRRFRSVAAVKLSSPFLFFSVLTGLCRGSDFCFLSSFFHFSALILLDLFVNAKKWHQFEPFLPSLIVDLLETFVLFLEYSGGQVSVSCSLECLMIMSVTQKTLLLMQIASQIQLVRSSILFQGFHVPFGSKKLDQERGGEEPNRAEKERNRKQNSRELVPQVISTIRKQKERIPNEKRQVAKPLFPERTPDGGSVASFFMNQGSLFMIQGLLFMF